MRIKNKKAMEGGTWMIIVGAIVAIMIAGIILYIVKGGLETGKQNVDALASCESQGGHCKLRFCLGTKPCVSKCGTNEESYYEFGCPKFNYCCLPKT